MLTLLSRDDGMHHLPGSTFCMFETLCGACDTTDQYTKSSELPSCPGCIDTARLVFESITKPQLKKCTAMRPTYRRRDGSPANY